MANIFDSAKYILEKTGPMSGQKLQRLCYYAQAWSLVWNREPLFREEFRAWKTGPVCGELHEMIRGKTVVCSGDVTGGEGDLTGRQKESIDIAVSFYSPHSAQRLAQLALTEDPWRRTKEGCAITKESMSKYYNSLLCASGKAVNSGN